MPARLRPAVSAMAGIAITLLSFIVLPSRGQKSLISLSVEKSYAAYMLVPRGEMTDKSVVNVT